MAGMIFIVIWSALCQHSMVTDSGVRSQRLGAETTGAGVSGVTPGVVTVTTSPRPRVETSSSYPSVTTMTENIS